jgi:ParB-like chromosome segregation protein Spo0J
MMKDPKRGKTGAAKPIPEPVQPEAPTLALALAEPSSLALTSLERDPAINCRAGGVSEGIAKGYAEALQAGGVFPPVIVFRDAEGKSWLADGFHRVRAHELVGREEVPVDLREGDRRAALFFAASANKDHGAQRSNKDKRKAVLVLVNDAGWASMSDAEIARHAGVSDRFVAKLRPSTPNGSGLRKGKDGKQRRMPKASKKSKAKGKPAKAIATAKKNLDRVRRAWPKGEPLSPLAAIVRGWLATLEKESEDEASTSRDVASEEPSSPAHAQAAE